MLLCFLQVLSKMTRPWECHTCPKFKVIKILEYLTVQLYLLMENHRPFLRFPLELFTRGNCLFLKEFEGGKLHLLLCRCGPRFSHTHPSSSLPLSHLHASVFFLWVSFTVKRKNILKQLLKYFKLTFKYLKVWVFISAKLHLNISVSIGHSS